MQFQGLGACPSHCSYEQRGWCITHLFGECASRIWRISDADSALSLDENASGPSLNLWIFRFASGICRSRQGPAGKGTRRKTTSTTTKASKIYCVYSFESSLENIGQGNQFGAGANVAG